MTNVSNKFDPINCNYTTWSPDTCKCTITYEWDKSTRDTPEIREHRPLHPAVELIGNSGPVDHHKKCEDHKHLEDTKEYFETVLEENQRKNIAHVKLGSDKTVIWEWTGTAPNRTLHIYDETKRKLAEVKKE